MTGPDAATPPPAAVAASTGFVLSKVTQRALELVHEAFAPLGIRSRHYGVLAALAEAGPQTQQALGAWLRIDRTTMVALVDDLERLGLVERRRAPADRRAYALCLTTTGERVLADARERVAAADVALLAPLSADERARLRLLLDKLLDAPRGPGETPG